METYKGRWGYHSIDYPTFRKLKTLHKRYWETVYSVARWARWNRKTVHRHGPEPRYCPFFVEEKGCWQSFTNRDGHTCYRFKPKTMVDRNVCEAYKTARMPAEGPEQVKELGISKDEIDRLYDKVEAWFDNEQLARKETSPQS